MRALCTILLAVAAHAGGTPVDDGNRAYAEGRYADAIRCYLQAQEKDGFSANLLFDLGNAYARSGDVGHAVLSYERALLLSARDAGVREELANVRRGAGLASDPGRGWRDYHRYLTQDEWTWLGLAGGLVLLAVLLGRRRLPRASLVRLAGVGFLLALPAATALAKHALERDRAIVVADKDVDLRVSPYEEAEALGTLRPGQVVWITRSFDGFVMVRRPGGGAGWVPRTTVEPVTP